LGDHERTGHEPLSAENRVARAGHRDDDVLSTGLAVGLGGLCPGALAKLLESLARAAVGGDMLDRRQRRPDARDLRLGLMTAPDHTEGAGPTPGEMTRRDAARGAGPEPAEMVGLDYRRERGRVGIEEADDEHRSLRGRCVELAARQPERPVGRGHVRERAIGEPQPAARRILHLARREPAERVLDRLHRARRIDQLGDVGLGQVQGHDPQV
jgi:hypothetical protein